MVKVISGRFKGFDGQVADRQTWEGKLFFGIKSPHAAELLYVPASETEVVL